MQVRTGPYKVGGQGISEAERYRVGERNRNGLARAGTTRVSPLEVARRLVGADVDAPAGQPGGEAGVLALLADRQRELEVGDDDPADAGRASTISTS